MWTEWSKSVHETTAVMRDWSAQGRVGEGLLLC